MSDTQNVLLNVEQINQVAAPLASAATLPKDAYTSEEVYAQEQNNITSTSWMPVARVEQLKQAGSYISIEINQQPLIVIKGDDGVIRVMSNVCLHRSAVLTQGEGVQLKISCPYHAWTYNSKGELIAAPMMNDCEGFDKKQHQLPLLKIEIWQGFVMANFDADAAAFAPQVKTYEDYFANFQLQEHEIVKTLEFDSHWNWKVLVENFMEAYHHIAIHANTLQPGYPARSSSIIDNDGPWSILQMPGLEFHESGISTVAGLTEIQQRSLFAGVIFPHFLIAVQGNLLLWYQVLPRSSSNMLLRIHLCVHKDNLALPQLEELVEGTTEIVNLVHSEDIAANDLVWKGLNAPLTKQGRLSGYEKSIWQLNQWWLSKMGL